MTGANHGRVAAAASLALLAACRVPPEGMGTPGPVAQVRYEIVADDNFSQPLSGDTFCVTPDTFEWVINKLVDDQNRPTAIPRVLLVNPGDVDANGRCVLRVPASGWVPPGKYRVVATDYAWIATCDVTLIAQATSGTFHNLRFVKGSPGCTPTILKAGQ